jgi:hypothetical protein
MLSYADIKLFALFISMFKQWTLHSEFWNKLIPCELGKFPWRFNHYSLKELLHVLHQLLSWTRIAKIYKALCTVTRLVLRIAYINKVASEDLCEAATQRSIGCCSPNISITDLINLIFAYNTNSRVDIWVIHVYMTLVKTGHSVIYINKNVMFVC